MGSGQEWWTHKLLKRRLQSKAIQGNEEREALELEIKRPRSAVVPDKEPAAWELREALLNTDLSELIGMMGLGKQFPDGFLELLELKTRLKRHESSDDREARLGRRVKARLERKK